MRLQVECQGVGWRRVGSGRETEKDGEVCGLGKRQQSGREGKAAKDYAVREGGGEKMREGEWRKGRSERANMVRCV